MVVEIDTEKKFIIGWLTLKPGKRDEFMTLSRSFVEATRQERGVIFFEFHHDLANSDGIVVVECYENREAHETHHQTPHFQAIWKVVQRLAVKGKFENIYAHRLLTDVSEFDALSNAENSG